MGRSRYKIHDDLYPHFLTCTIVAWLPVFNRPEAAQIVLDSLKFQHETNRIKLFGYVIMENHLHYIASGPSLNDRVKEFKSFTARQIVEFLKARDDHDLLGSFHRLKREHRVESEYQIWQEGSHPVEIGTDGIMNQKLDYTHNNPVKRGYVDLPEHWRYSSARNYLGLPGLIPVQTDWRS